MKLGVLIFTCIFGLLAVVYMDSGALQADGKVEEAAEAPSSISFSAKNGDVSFDHKLHTEKEKDCMACHHTLTEGETPKKCGACHFKDEEKDGAPVRKTAFHDQCKGCHKQQFEEKKIEKKIHLCKSCHIKKAVEE